MGIKFPIEWSDNTPGLTANLRQGTSALDAFSSSTKALKAQFAAAQLEVKNLETAIKDYHLEAASGGNPLAKMLADARAEADRLKTALASTRQATADALKAPSDTSAKKAVEDIGTAADKSATQLVALGRGLKEAGTLMTAAFTVPIVGAAAAAVHFGGDFETQMTRVVTLAGASTTEVAGLRSQVLALGPATGVGPAELAKGLFVLESYGLRGAVAMDALTTAAKMSALGMGETSEVARGLTGVLFAYKNQNLSAADAGDILTKTVQLGNMKIGELIPALATVGPIAASMGVKFQDTAASIATFTHAGVDASLASTGMRALLNNILTDSVKTEKGFAALAAATGDNTISMANFRKEMTDNGLTAAMVHLTESVTKAGDAGVKAMGEIFPNIRALTQAMAVYKLNGGMVVDILEQMTKAHGTVAVSTVELHKTWAYQWDAMKAEMDRLWISMSDSLLPIFKAVASFLRTVVVPAIEGVVTAFNGLPTAVQYGAFAVAGLLAAIGPGLFVLGSLAQAVGHISLALPLLQAAMATSVVEGGVLATVWGVLTTEITLDTIAVAANAVVLGGWAAVASAATGAVGLLSAAVIAMPFAAAAVGIGLAVLAIEHLIAAKAELALADATAGAKQDVITLAMSRGANSQIAYADAVKYNAEWVRKLLDPMTAINARLQELTNNGASATEKARALAAGVLDLSNKGQLGATQIAEVVKTVKAFGLTAADLPPSLRNILAAMTPVVAGTQTLADKVALLTEKEREDILAKRAQGESIKAIAAETKIAADVVSAFLKQMALAGKDDKAAERELLARTRAADDVQALIDRAAASEASTGEKGLAKTLEQIATKQRAEEAAWQKKVDTGVVFMDEYGNAIYAIERHYANLSADAIVTDEEKKAAVAAKELGIRQGVEDQIQKIRDAGFAAEAATGTKGLAQTLARLRAEETAEELAWQKKVDTGTVNMDEYGNAIQAIRDKFGRVMVAKEVDWETQKWHAIGEINLQAEAIEASLLGDRLQTKLAANEKELQSRIATLTLEQKLDTDYLVALKRLYDDKAKAIIAAQDPLLVAFKNLNTDMRNTWAGTWSQALDGTVKFEDAFVTTLEQSLWAPFKNVLAGMLADFENILLSPMISALRQLETAFVNYLVRAGLVAAGAGGGGGGDAISSGFVNTGESVAESAGTKWAYSAIAAHFAAPSSAYVGAGVANVAAASMPGATSAGAVAFNPATVYGVGTNASTAGGGSALGTLGAVAPIAGAGIAGWALGSYLGSKTESKPLGAAVGAAAGAGAGAAIGAPFAGATFGLSIAAGAIVGAIAGWRAAGHLYEEVKTSQAELLKQMGGMEAEIKNVGDAYALTGHTGAEAERALHAMWDAKTPEEFAKAVKPVAEALQALQQNTADLQAATTDATGRISEAWTRVIALNTKYGSNTKEVLAFISQQTAVAVSGFNDVVAAQMDAVAGYDNLKKAVDDAQASVDALVKSGTKGAPLTLAQNALATAKGDQAAAATHAAPELADLGTQAVGNYAASVASGMSPIDATNAQSNALTVLEQEYKDLGLTVDDVGLKALFTMNDMTKASGTLMSGVSGLTKEMVGLDNIGLETKENFAAQQRTGEAMYTRLQGAASATAKANGDLSDQTAAALLPMQGYLHAAVEEAKKLNVPLDAMTQQMVDQSKDAGVWKDAIKPPPTVRDAIQLLADTVDDLARALRGLPPITHVHVDETHATTTTTPEGPPDQQTPDGPDHASTGGLVTPSGIAQYLESGGTASNWPWIPKGTDTVPAMLTPGERVLSVADTHAYDALLKVIAQPSQTLFPGGSQPFNESIYGSIGAVPIGWAADPPTPLPGRDAVFTDDQLKAGTTTTSANGRGNTVVLQESFTFQVTLPPGGIANPDYVEKELMPQIVGQIEDRRRGYTARLQRALGVDA